MSKRGFQLGKGGQYTVERRELMFIGAEEIVYPVFKVRPQLIAIKKPIPIFGDAEDFTGLRSFMTELQVLSHDCLQSHRNIVRPRADPELMES